MIHHYEGKHSFIWVNSHTQAVNYGIHIKIVTSAPTIQFVICIILYTQFISAILNVMFQIQVHVI